MQAHPSDVLLLLSIHNHERVAAHGSYTPMLCRENVCGLVLWCWLHFIWGGSISWSWVALIGQHEVSNCSPHQSRPPLWAVSVCVTHWWYSIALWVWMVALTHHLPLPLHPLWPAHPYRPNLWYYRSWKKPSEKPEAFKKPVELAMKW